MNYQLPPEYKLTKKENKDIEEKFHPLVKSFLEGLLFFITAPIKIYNKIHRRLKGGKENGNIY